MSHCEGGEGGAVFGRETETQNRESGTLVVWEKRMWSLCWLCISCFCLMVVICTYYQLLFFSNTHTHTHDALFLTLPQAFYPCFKSTLSVCESLWSMANYSVCVCKCVCVQTRMHILCSLSQWVI